MTNLITESLPDQPIHTPSALRSIPGYAYYWVDVEGNVYRKKDTAHEPRMTINGMPHVEVPHRAQGRVNPWTPVHILVARAWVPRRRPYYKFRDIVHIDGDTMNCHASNLRWVRTSSADERHR